MFALPPESSDQLGEKLAGFVKAGGVESVVTKDNSTVTINFAHVAAAYVDDLNRKKVFGLN